VRLPLTDPQDGHDPATGTVAPASWGDDVRNGIMYLGQDKPHCRVYNDANISINTATNTMLTFNQERFDVGGLHSTASNTSRITIPTGEAGKYLIGCNVRWASNATGVRSLGVVLNGTTTIAFSLVDIDSAINHAQSLVTMYSLAATDYVEVQVSQTSGGPLNVETLGNFSPEFWAMWMAV
jgi:hypothetical protein